MPKELLMLFLTDNYNKTIYEPDTDIIPSGCLGNLYDLYPSSVRPHDKQPLDLFCVRFETRLEFLVNYDSDGSRVHQTRGAPTPKVGRHPENTA